MDLPFKLMVPCRYTPTYTVISQHQFEVADGHAS